MGGCETDEWMEKMYYFQPLIPSSASHPSIGTIMQKLTSESNLSRSLWQEKSKYFATIAKKQAAPTQTYMSPIKPALFSPNTISKIASSEAAALVRAQMQIGSIAAKAGHFH
jgi:hypothetical protein